MRAVRTGALIGVALVGGAMMAFNVVNCASATTITLEVRGDQEICSKIYETGIAVTTAKGVDDTNDFPLNEVKKGCVDGAIGKLVITPRSKDSADRNARIGVRVVAGVDGKEASQCDDADGKAGINCIIVKRTVTFVEGENVRVGVTLSGRCVHFQCESGFSCNPDEADPAKRCVQTNPDPGSSSSGGPITKPPIDSGPEPEEDAEAGPPTPAQICNAKSTHSWDAENNKCVVTCGPNGEDCKLPGACPPGLDCSFLCVGDKACEGVNCSGGKCEFNCTANNTDLCKNISCDAGSCNVICRKRENVCNGVLLLGKTNTMECEKAESVNDVSCDDVRCVPGPTGTCTRKCDGPAPNACGPKAECDAGDCSNFEDGGLPLP